MTGEILIGTCSWADRTLLASGWYPAEARTPAARLAHYASRFPLVEVDATYYALPSERNAALWAERTPVEFTFNVKAFALMTGHPTQVKALPPDLRQAAGNATRVYASRLPPEAVERIWEGFRKALEPLRAAGKLGCVLFQFPEWFTPTRENREEILRCAERLPDDRICVEFRQRAWMDPPERADRTLAWLAEHHVPYVCVDMPQGFASSVPPVAAATAGDLALVRLHGRNTGTWMRKGITAAERFDYLYREEELREWVPRVRRLAETARRTHVLFNNCYRDKGVRNAAQMRSLLGV